MNQIKKNKKSFFSGHDFNSFFEGFDIAVLLNLSPFIALYLFENIYTTNLSVLVTVSLILISYAVRIFCNFLSLHIKKIKYEINQNLLIILILSYLILMIVPNSFLILTLLLILFNRILIGYYNAVFSSPLVENNSKKLTKYFNIKLWLLFVGGVFIGLFVCKIINQAYSNLQLNNGLWKVGIIPILVMLVLKYFFDKRNEILNINNNENLNNFLKLKSFKNYSENISIIIPLMVFILFTMTSWLSNYVIPENKQLSQISHINIILIIMVFLSANFIFRLFKKSLPFLIVNISGLIIFFVLFFVTNNISSYSIDLLHFTISLFAGLSLSIFKINIEINNDSFEKKFSFPLNFYLLIIAVLIPIVIYYLLFSSVQYKNIYLLLFLVYLISFIGYFSSRNLKNN